MQNSSNFNKLYKSRSGFIKAMELHKAEELKITVPFETKTITTTAGTTYIRIAGPATAEPVFLWHGLNIHGGSWHHQINDLANTYQLFVPDIIGGLGKSAPTRLNRKGTAYGHWMAEVMTTLNVPVAHHVGISNGGWMILKLATADFSKIGSATLISSAGFVNAKRSLIFKMLPGLLLSRGINKAYHFAKVMSPPNTKPDQSFVQLVDIMLNQFRFEQAPKAVSNKELQCLKAPTYLLMGEYEAAFDVNSVINRAKTYLPNLKKYEIVPRVGHGMIGENIAGVNTRIQQFLQEQPLV